jgi:hypothetical protein
MAEAAEQGWRGRRAGQFVFALGFVALSALLLAQLGGQTRLVENTDTVAQPRFWPAVALGMMVGFGALHLWHLPRRRRWDEERREARRWLRPLEFVIWFMVYVWAVPIIGFLPSTLVFAPLLVWRLGYRAARYYWAAAAFAVVAVVLFKGLLAVRIPGGAVYEYLPGAWRGFAILWL